MRTPNQSYRAYYQTNVQTSDQLTLIIMLYDGMVRFLRKAESRAEANDIEGTHNYLMRSKDIVNELLSTLRVENTGEIGQNLRELYLYMFRRIVEANLRKDPEVIRELIKVAETLRQGWNQLRQQNTAQKQRAAVQAAAERGTFRAQG